jgi:hypothetical protein
MHWNPAKRLLSIKKPLLAAALPLIATAALGQVRVNGTVYDKSMMYGMRGVSVMSASGTGTLTDSLGHYQIRLATTDSIYFSYLGRATTKFPVKDIPAGFPFDMSLEVVVDSLPSVFVRSANYREDSLENRREYKKIFDYEADYVTGMKSNKCGAGFGVGLDFDLLLDGKKNRRMLAFQQRLEEEEKDKYIDHRFTRSIVKRVTGLLPPALDTFMRQYRPSYEFIQSCETEYEFYKYILEWSQFFEKDWKTTHPDQTQAP